MKNLLITDLNGGIPVQFDIYRKDFLTSENPDISTVAKKEALFTAGYDYYTSASEAVLGDGVQVVVQDPVNVNAEKEVSKVNTTTGGTTLVKPQIKSLYKVKPRVDGLDSQVTPFYSDYEYYPASVLQKIIDNTSISLVNKRNVKFLEATGYSVSYSAGIVTVTVTRSGGHGFVTGRPLSITGLSIPAYNISTTITVLNSSQFKYTFTAASNPGTPTGSLTYSSQILGYYSCDAKILLHQVNNGGPNDMLAEVWIKNQADENGSALSFLQTFYSDDWKVYVTRNNGITTQGDPYLDVAYSFDGMKLNPSLPLDTTLPAYHLICSGVITNYSGFPD